MTALQVQLSRGDQSNENGVAKTVMQWWPTLEGEDDNLSAAEFSWQW